jgi:hypothetical protein
VGRHRCAVAVLEIVIGRSKCKMDAQPVVAPVAEAVDAASLPEVAERVASDRLVVGVLGGVILDLLGDDVARRRDLDLDRSTLVPEDERVARKDKEQDLVADGSRRGVSVAGLADDTSQDVRSQSRSEP